MKKIPVEIEIIGTNYRKSIGWSAVGYAVGSLLAGPVGGIIGVITQGNEQDYTLVVKFSDNTQKTLRCNKTQLNLELIVWTWRIQNKKSEKDYVTFGVDFERLNYGDLASNAGLLNYLGLEDKQKLGELWDTLKLEMALNKFFKSEIERYFREQRGKTILVTQERGGFKIPPKFNYWFNGLLLAIFVIFLGYVVFVNFTKPNTDYRPSVEYGQ